MENTKHHPSKSQLVAEILSRQQQVATIEKRERESAVLKQKQMLLVSEQALLLAIDNYTRLPFSLEKDLMALTAHLISARALLECIVKEQIHA